MDTDEHGLRSGGAVPPACGCFLIWNATLSKKKKQHVLTTIDESFAHPHKSSLRVSECCPLPFSLAPFPSCCPDRRDALSYFGFAAPPRRVHPWFNGFSGLKLFARPRVIFCAKLTNL